MEFVIPIIAFGMLALWITHLWHDVNKRLSQMEKSQSKIIKDLEQMEIKWFASFNTLKEMRKNDADDKKREKP